MTEREFLNRRARRIRERLAANVRVVGEELERAAGPTIREHPGAGLAVAASAGFVAGSLVGGKSSGGGGGRGMIAGVGAFLGSTGAQALRVKLVEALVSVTEARETDAG